MEPNEFLSIGAARKQASATASRAAVSTTIDKGFSAHLDDDGAPQSRRGADDARRSGYRWRETGGAAQREANLNSAPERRDDPISRTDEPRKVGSGSRHEPTDRAGSDRARDKNSVQNDEYARAAGEDTSPPVEDASGQSEDGGDAVAASADGPTYAEQTSEIGPPAEESEPDLAPPHLPPVAKNAEGVAPPILPGETPDNGIPGQIELSHAGTVASDEVSESGNGAGGAPHGVGAKGATDNGDPLQLSGVGQNADPEVGAQETLPGEARDGFAASARSDGGTVFPDHRSIESELDFETNALAAPEAEGSAQGQERAFAAQNVAPSTAQIATPGVLGLTAKESGVTGQAQPQEFSASANISATSTEEPVSDLDANNAARPKIGGLSGEGEARAGLTQGGKRTEAAIGQQNMFDAQQSAEVSRTDSQGGGFKGFSTSTSATSATAANATTSAVGEISGSAGQTTAGAATTSPLGTSVRPAGQAPIPQPSVPVPALAAHIARQYSNGQNKFQIRLDPPELGRIDVRMEVTRDGVVTTHLIVERPETLDLMQRDAKQLERALSQAGLETKDGGLSFSLQERSLGHEQFGRGSDGNDSFRNSSGDSDGLDVADQDGAISENYVATSAVDIRV